MGVIRKDNLTISTAIAVWLNTLSGYFEHEPPPVWEFFREVTCPVERHLRLHLHNLFTASDATTRYAV
jgi:hypothetical protein